ncbi:MAG: SMC-Scp complex subunit ScpB [Chitinophagales bacterium]|nr:SMC-Scp complex subunit ScpB [Chitinophagales bacterium]MDW8274704.1 SMC-Scp complex subunit ScpB [Chitinophagales bacterium]
MENLHQHIEALIFSSESAITKAEIISCIEKISGNIIDEQIVDQILKDITEKYKPDFYAFELRVIGGGYQFFTKPDYHKTVSILIGQREKKKLSTAALETLSIIAYRGPVTKAECEQIRGVNCDYSIQKLLEKELIEIAGRVEDAPGKPVLYRVTQNFLDYFGINSTDELPKLKEIIPESENVIGQPRDLQEESPQPEADKE